MSAHRMTDDQREAVDSVSGDLAISAGAGSGKTTVLAHRFAHALDSAARAEWAPADVDRILTITFTNKAAGEIAERVRRVVTFESSRELGRRVGEAWISTIHTFCGRLVRRHLLEAGVDPGFTQLDDVGQVATATEAFDAAVTDLLDRGPAALRLVDGWGFSALRQAVISCHDNVRAMGLDPADTEVPDGREGIGALLLDVLEAASVLADEIDRCKQSDTVIEKARRLDEWCRLMRSCELGEVDACARLAEVDSTLDIPRLPAETKPAREALKTARDTLTAALSVVQESALLAELQVLVRGFAVHFRRLKAERSALDFDDLQELAARLLAENPEIAKRYREHFRMLMVDEFQDTNELQMRVLAPLRNNNLCIVGDERQSIYGFRYADVAIFEQTRGELGHQVKLRANFRSHPGILGVVNGMFSRPELFGGSFMQLSAGRREGWKLNLSAQEPRVECVLVDGETVAEACAAEAEYLAERAAALIGAGEVTGGDIAILLRSGTHAAEYATAFERREIPVLVSAGVTLYDARETSEVMHLLRAIAVPTDDEALAHTLSGRLVGLSDDALLALRISTPRGRPLWDGLRAVGQGREEAVRLNGYDREAALHAFRVLDSFGEAQGRLGLAELVHHACEAFDYDLTLFSSGAAGVRAWGNVLKIARAADAFERAESRDTAAFVSHLERRREDAKDRAAAEKAGGEAVRIMTVHSAKGLEFPVVFVAGLHASRSSRPSPLRVGRARAHGREVPVVGVCLPKGLTEVPAATSLHASLSTEAALKDVEEEKRCLYVAATRAQELLVLSGRAQLGKPPVEGKAHIDWVREALGDPDVSGTVEVGAAPVAVTVIEAACGTPDAPTTGEQAAPGVTVFATPPVSDTAATTPLFLAPAVVSYSSLHRHELCPLSYHAKSTLRLGRFREPNQRGATDFGSAVHAVLQSTTSGGPAAGAIDAACLRYSPDAGQREQLVRAVDAFVNSPLAAAAYAGERVFREEPLRVRIGETVLTGSIDLISWTGKAALVVDYKTGRMPEGPDDQRIKGYELQAQCYALAAFEDGAENVRAVFCFVEHEARTISFDMRREDAAQIRRHLETRIERIASGEITHLDVYDSEVCPGCPALGTICPVDEPPGYAPR